MKKMDGKESNVAYRYKGEEAEERLDYPCPEVTSLCEWIPERGQSDIVKSQKLLRTTMDN